MTFAQVDRARLTGDALRRWYVRSPDEIAQERAAAAAQTFHNFFNGKDPASQTPPLSARKPLSGGAQDDAGVEWTTTTANRWQGSEAGLNGPVTPHQNAAVYRPTNEGVDCIGCHGRLAPPTLPFPWTWGGGRLLRDTSTSPPSKPPERDRKQCDLQHRADTDICNGNRRKRRRRFATGVRLIAIHIA